LIPAVSKSRAGNGWSAITGNAITEILGVARSSIARTSPKIPGEVLRLQQTRNDDHATGTGLKKARQILPLDSADAEYRDGTLPLDGGDVRWTDRLILRLGRRGEDRTEADVVDRFPKRGTGLIQTMRRFPDDASGPQELAHRVDGGIVLTDMNAICIHLNSDLREVVDHEGNPGIAGNRNRGPGEGSDLSSGKTFGPKLKNVDASGSDEPTSHFDQAARSDVTEIEDAIEPGVGRTFSWHRWIHSEPSRS